MPTDHTDRQEVSLSRDHPLMVEANRDMNAGYTLHMHILSPDGPDRSSSITTILRGETGSPVSRWVIADEQM